MPTLAPRVSCRCAKMGVGGGRLAEQPPGWLSQSNTVPRPGGRQDRGEGWVGAGVPVYSCVYSGVFSVRYRAGVSVCEPPPPRPA